jgi:hypothetical protein
VPECYLASPLVPRVQSDTRPSGEWGYGARCLCGAREPSGSATRGGGAGLCEAPVNSVSALSFSSSSSYTGFCLSTLPPSLLTFVTELDVVCGNSAATPSHSLPFAKRLPPPPPSPSLSASVALLVPQLLVFKDSPFANSKSCSYCYPTVCPHQKDSQNIHTRPPIAHTYLA